MIASSFVDSISQFMSWLSERQWAEWEIITIAVIALFVLLWIIRWQRKRAIRNIYDNQFLENTPVIGTKLGSRKRRRHLIKDFKKAQLAAAQHGHTNQQKSAKKTESEKLHEQIKQLQREIIKRKQAEVRFEQRIADLTTANEKFQLKLAEKEQAEEQTEETSAAEEQQKPEIPESKKASQDIEEQAAVVPDVEKSVEEKPAGIGNKSDDLHGIVDGVKQKLCRKCKEWKSEIEFHKNASSKDGLAGSCKTCKAEAAREYRKRRAADKE